MAVTELVFETHSTTEDNERSLATGWLPGRLSPTGRQQAGLLGDRRRHDGLAAVFTSDLARAVETVTIAFDGSDVPVLHDWRLRECDYGDQNGSPVAELARERHIDVPYPGGESWRQAIDRIASFLDDVPLRWAGARVLVVGHTATRWGLDCLLSRAALEELVEAPFEWRPGGEYRLTT